MEARLDHVRIAEENLDSADNAALGSPDELAWCVSAQVHATLALHEQQRVANLIALAAVSEPRLRVVLLDDAMDSLTVDRMAGL